MHKPFTPSPESFLSVLDLYRTQTIPAQPTIQRTAAFPFLHKVSSTSLSSKGTFLAFDDLYIVYIKSSAFDSQVVWVGGKACLWKSEWGVWKFWKDNENEKWKEEEEKSVSRSSIYRSCILLGTTIFGININMLCLVQAICITICPHAAIILYIIWVLFCFFNMVWQWMNFCWTLYFHLKKHAGVFQKKVRKWNVRYYGVQYVWLGFWFF